MARFTLGNLGAVRLTAHCFAVRGRARHDRVTAYVPTPVLLILAAITALKVGLSLLSGMRLHHSGNLL